MEVDLAKARKYGLKPGDVRRQSSTLLASEEVADLFHGGKAYDVHVWSIPSARNSLTDVQNLPIDTPGGGRVRLEQVADVESRRRPNTIEREYQSRRIDVGANVKEGCDLAAIVERGRGSPRGRQVPTATTPRCSASRPSSTPRRTACGCSASAPRSSILLLLQAAFRSLRLAVLTFLLLPMALVGGVLAVWLGDGILSLGSLVGFLTVFGIAARNGILMISHFQHLERHEGMPFGPALVLRGAKERLAPILMTALRDRPRARAAGHRRQHPRP